MRKISRVRSRITLNSTIRTSTGILSPARPWPGPVLMTPCSRSPGGNSCAASRAACWANWPAPCADTSKSTAPGPRSGPLPIRSSRLGACLAAIAGPIMPPRCPTASATLRDSGSSAATGSITSRTARSARSPRPPPGARCALPARCWARITISTRAMTMCCSSRTAPLPARPQPAAGALACVTARRISRPAAFGSALWQKI